MARASFPRSPTTPTRTRSGSGRAMAPRSGPRSRRSPIEAGSRWVTPGRPLSRHLCSARLPHRPRRRPRGGTARASRGTRAPWPRLRLYATSFSQDGSAIWLLLDRVAYGRHEAQVASAGRAGQSSMRKRAPSTSARMSATSGSTGWLATAGRRSPSATGSAHRMALQWSTDPWRSSRRRPTRTAPLHSGRFVGFMPGSLLDSIPGEGAFDDVPDAPVPTSPPQPPASPEQTAEPGSTAPPEPSVAGG